MELITLVNFTVDFFFNLKNLVSDKIIAADLSTFVTRFCSSYKRYGCSIREHRRLCPSNLCTIG